MRRAEEVAPQSQEENDLCGRIIDSEACQGFTWNDKQVHRFLIFVSDYFDKKRLFPVQERLVHIYLSFDQLLRVS